MTANIFLFLLLVGSYLLGSIPFGKIISSRNGIDIQTRGSGNIGFANVRRIVGWRAGIFTLTGDILKGLLPSLVAYVWYGELWAFIVGVLAIAGHVFPIWLKFKGGKGVATGLGCVVVLSPIAAAIGSIVYVITAGIFKKSGVGSIIGIIIAAGIAITLAPSTWWQYVSFVVIFGLTLRKNLLGTVPNYDK